MNKPVPLPRAPMSYISAPPYTTSFEWLEENTLIASYRNNIEDAFKAFWEFKPGLREQGSPDRRVIFDGRGIVIFGTLDYLLVDNDNWVATSEALAVQHGLGMDHDELVELELRVMYLNEHR